jgi:hypothetical protein
MNGLQHVVCRAAIDSDFLKLLAHSPIDALYGFDVAEDEASLIVNLRPQSLKELALGVEAWRRGDVGIFQPTVRAPAMMALAS